MVPGGGGRRLGPALERAPIPTAQLGGGAIAAVQEGQHLGVGVGRAAHRPVGEHQLSQ
jgi:hypothetical protein